MADVWAPFAERVELETPGGRSPMRRSTDGWWHADAEPQRYRFVVDGVALADPRSADQPDGVDGWSRVVDHDAFAWTDDGWHGRDLARSVLYELHVGTFSAAGTFDGAIEHLDHLVALGVDAIEVMPVATFPGRWGWGYDGVGLFAVQHTYGGSAGLKRFVDACHGRGVAVVLDVVYNHLGPAGNHLHRLGPYFTDAHSTPWGQAINFDTAGSAEVRRFVVDNALHWVVDHHVDGLRLDAVHAIVDTSPVDILREIGEAVHAAGERAGRTTWVIAESDLNDPRLVRPVGAGGYGLDAAWSDDFHHALHVALTGEHSGYYADYRGLADVAESLEHVFVYRGQMSPSRGRPHGTPVGDIRRSHFVGFDQNHDQVGNRALGDRLGQLVGVRRAQVALAIVLTAPFVPLLFAGEEWGASTPFQYFTDHADAELAEAIRSGRRREFEGLITDTADVPDPQSAATYARSQLDWSEVEAGEHAVLLAWTTDLIALRRGEPDLTDDDPAHVRVAVDADAGWLTMRRGAVELVVNLGDAQVVPTSEVAEVILSNDPRVVVKGAVTPGAGGVNLPADSVAVVRLLG